MKMIFLQPSQNTAPATQDARAQIHWWPQVKMHFVRSEHGEKKRVSPAPNANFESDM